MGVNLHCVAAMRDMACWCDVLNHGDKAARYRTMAANLTAIIARYFAGEFTATGDAWDAHRLPPPQRRACDLVSS